MVAVPPMMQAPTKSTKGLTIFMFTSVPAASRPMQLAIPMIETRKEASSSLTPCSLAASTMKVNGMKKPDEILSRFHINFTQ